MERVRKHPGFTAAALILTATLLGMLLVIYATQQGPGVGSDSTIYLTSAQNLLSGNGLGWFEPDGSFHRLDYYPPFYPLALMLPGLILSDVVTGARWLNVLLFGGLVALIGTWFYQATRQPVLAGVLTGVLAVSPVLIGVAVWAMSEPVFLLTGFTGLALLARYLSRPRLDVLALAALMTGLAFLSRYLGVAFVMTGVLVLLTAPFAEQRSIRDRFRRSIIFGAVAVAPMILWLLLDYASSGTIGGRSGMPLDRVLPRFLNAFIEMESIVLFWLLPESIVGRLPGIMRLLGWLLPLTALAVGSVWIWRKYTQIEGPEKADRLGGMRMAWIMGLFVLVYILVLAVLQSVIYPPVAVDLRMLSPVHLAVIVLVFALAHLALKLPGTRNKYASALVLLAALALFGMYTLRGGLVAHTYQQTGIGYSSAGWRESQLLQEIDKLPAAAAVITNDKAALMFLANRPAYEVLEIYQDEPDWTFPEYGSGTDKSQQVFREQGGALVLFHASLAEDFAIYGDRAAERLAALTGDLYKYYEGEDGSIYFYHPPAEN